MTHSIPGDGSSLALLADTHLHTGQADAARRWVHAWAARTGHDPAPVLTALGLDEGDNAHE